MDIKKSALSMLGNMATIRSDAKNEVNEHGVLQQCLKHIENFPDEDVDSSVLVLSLGIISQAVSHFILN